MSPLTAIDATGSVLPSCSTTGVSAPSGRSIASTSVRTSCYVDVERPAPQFIRGDCDGDGRFRGIVTDAVYLLNFNFLGTQEPPCLVACHANGDGLVRGTVTDAIYLLTFNFLGGPPPLAPFPDCGPENSVLGKYIGCEEPPASCQ